MAPPPPPADIAVRGRRAGGGRGGASSSPRTLDAEAAVAAAATEEDRTRRRRTFPHRRPLLPFETEPPPPAGETSARALKDRGDALLRLRDYAAAASYYEAALDRTSRLSVGGSVILSSGGRPTVAEVDCVDGEDVDVSHLGEDGEATGEESTVRGGDVLLCPAGDGAGRELQVRALLNLSRCMLRLAEVDVAGGRASARPARYRRAAVLGCTLAASVSSHGGSRSGDDDGEAIGWGGKARLLRAQAYAELGKLKHAAGDLRWISKRDPENREAARLERELDRRAALARRTDKKLAKEMCVWVQKATDAAGGDGGAGPL